MTAVIDADQHLYEARTLWAENIDPALRDEALAVVDDERGYPWLTWKDLRLDIADVQRPGDTAAIGNLRERYRNGLPPAYDYDAFLPDDLWEPGARVGRLDAMGIDEAVVFPNFGLLWERRMSGSLRAVTANMGAWNRWCASIVTDGHGRLHPVAHLTLRDPDWLGAQLKELAAAGVHLGMIAPAAVDGRPLSHPDHDRLWRAFVESAVTPVFHVANQPRALDDAFYTDPEDSLTAVLDSVFLWAPPAIAVTDLIVNGTFTRVPDLRLGIIELSSIWVPQYLVTLDGGWDFSTALNGRPLAPLAERPSWYFRHHVRVASFSYEQPKRLMDMCGDLFLACSDFPHAEGTATPLEDYAASGLQAKESPGFFRDNASFLLGRAEFV